MSGSGHEVVKEREGIAAKMVVLVKEWKEKMSGSVELRIARENLKILRMKIRELTEELSIAEEFEGELEAKRRRIVFCRRHFQVEGSKCSKCWSGGRGG